MKSRISRSLAPRFTCSRIWLRRSTASGAFESAMVWFWHTRQRSSVESAFTRFSTSGISCSRTEKERIPIKTQALATAGELLHQRLQLLLRDLRRHRADVLVADHALLVDDVGFRHAIDAVVDADAPRGVEHGELVGIAVLLQPRQRVLALVLVVEPHHRGDAGLRQVGDHRMLDEARRAPRRPHVEDPYLAQHV